MKPPNFALFAEAAHCIASGHSCTHSARPELLLGVGVLHLFLEPYDAIEQFGRCCHDGDVDSRSPKHPIGFNQNFCSFSMFFIGLGKSSPIFTLMV
jgi:hypothetical protein